MDRIFISTLSQAVGIEGRIKCGDTSPVLEVIVRESSHIKRFVWFLLKNDIQFNRVSAGAGIAIFSVDTKLKYFVEVKSKE